jgi:hypothetical protein
MGGPQDLKIVGFNKASNKAPYSFTAHGFLSQVITAPSTDDLFFPRDDEPKTERDEIISHLLFLDARDDQLPSNPASDMLTGLTSLLSMMLGFSVCTIPCSSVAST